MTQPTDLAVILAAAAPTFLASVALIVLARRIKRLDDKHECRKKESILILRGISVIGDLANATGKATIDGKPNGELHDAMENHKEYRKDLKLYLLEQNAEKNN